MSEVRTVVGHGVQLSGYEKHGGMVLVEALVKCLEVVEIGRCQTGRG
jgi:hypothetical protein